MERATPGGLQHKGQEFADVIKMGRTQLQERGANDPRPGVRRLGGDGGEDIARVRERRR